MLAAETRIEAVERGQCLRWVKNGRDALEMGRLYYPRKQTPISYAVDCDLIRCYSGAKPADKHLASTIHCIT
jgi:hypothetical protein